MNTITFLVPHAPDLSAIKKTLASYEQIHVEYYQLNDHQDVITKLIEQGTEIIVTRAGMASRIVKSGLPVKVIELTVTSFDVIRAVESAKKYGTNVAVVAYPSMVRGLECLLPYLNLAFGRYIVDSTDDIIEKTILQAAAAGADVIVGGGLICQAAKKHGLASVYIESGQEAISQAIHEALRLEEAIRAEKIKRSLFSAVFDNVRDAILTVDCQLNITSINLRAQQIFAVSETNALGKSIKTIWPSLSLSKVIRTRQEEIGNIMQVKGLKVICNKVPIVVNEKLNGTLITFQEISRIQQAEAHIRKEIYNKGHVARKSFANIWGGSTGLTRIIGLAKEFAATNSNILIVGETGTGKEVFAQSIHNHSPRSSGPFVAVNCAALPAQILESELFGYVAGAFTGANKDGKPGLFELAHGGTIFLDEIAEMDYVNQSRLLRVLQERSVMRLGSDRVIAIDTRVIAATNKDLKELVRTNKFREDLFFRLNVLKLELPPLRERRQDIRIIAENFLNKHTAPSRHLSFDHQAFKILESYHWPGNIRELENTIERLFAFCQTETIYAANVIEVLEKWDAIPSQISIHADEIQEIKEALIQAKGVQTAAAKLLGIDRTSLWRKMRRLGIRI